MRYFLSIGLSSILAFSLASAANADEGTQIERQKVKNTQSKVATRARDCSDIGSYTAEACQSYRENNYAGYSTGDSSRYSTSQGWSRGRYNWWWGGRSGSDIPTTGYTAPSRGH